MHASPYTSCAGEESSPAPTSGATKPSVPAAAADAGPARDPEVDQHDLAVPPVHEVRRLHVAVDDRGLVLVEMVEGGCRLADVLHHRRQRQAGLAPFRQLLFEVDAVHPVHDDHVPVTDEEVIPHRGDARMGLEIEEDLAFGNHLLLGAPRDRLHHFQGDLPLVLLDRAHAGAHARDDSR